MASLEVQIIRELDIRCPRCNRSNLNEVEAVGYEEDAEPYRFARCPKCAWAQPIEDKPSAP
jgi:ssDNA-binding Zn-finger/Zn-ribbon topoisomerase 1